MAHKWVLVRISETYDNCNPRILKLLVLHLRVDIDTREPASISRVRVVPSDSVLKTADLKRSHNVQTQEALVF